MGLSRVPHVDVGVNESGETDDTVRGDTVDVGLHWWSIETEKFKRLNTKEENYRDNEIDYILFNTTKRI